MYSRLYVQKKTVAKCLVVASLWSCSENHRQIGVIEQNTKEPPHTLVGNSYRLQVSWQQWGLRDHFISSPRTSLGRKLGWGDSGFWELEPPDLQQKKAVYLLTLKTPHPQEQAHSGVTGMTLSTEKKSTTWKLRIMFYSVNSHRT